MANSNNLIPNNQRSPSEVRANGAKGGRASGKVRREKKLMKDQLKILLSLPLKDETVKEGMRKLGIKKEDMNNQMAMIFALYKKSLKGDTKAFELIRDTIGEKPQDKINLSGSIETNNPYANLTEEELRKIIELGGSDV